MTTLPRRALVTRRLVLEPMAPLWAEGLWNAAEASLTELRPWMPWTAEASYEETLRFASTSEHAWSEGRDFDFAIRLGDDVIGGLGLSIIQPEARVAEVGYWIRSADAGRGFAVEAAASVVRFGFDHAELHRIELRAGVENARSRRVAEKLGFTLEAERLREACRGAFGYYDGCMYARLVSD